MDVNCKDALDSLVFEHIGNNLRMDVNCKVAAVLHLFQPHRNNLRMDVNCKILGIAAFAVTICGWMKTVGKIKIYNNMLPFRFYVERELFIDV